MYDAYTLFADGPLFKVFHRRPIYNIIQSSIICLDFHPVINIICLGLRIPNSKKFGKLMGPIWTAQLGEGLVMLIDPSWIPNSLPYWEPNSGPIRESSQVNFRLMAEYNISVSRLTKLHSRLTSNGDTNKSNVRLTLYTIVLACKYN